MRLPKVAVVVVSSLWYNYITIPFLFLGLQETPFPFDNDPSLLSSTSTPLLHFKTSSVHHHLLCPPHSPTPVYLSQHHFLSSSSSPNEKTQLEMDWGMKGQIPSFGNWDLYGELPVTQCFDTARRTGVFSHQFFMEDVDLDLFKVPASPVPSYHYQKPRRVLTEEKRYERSVRDLKDVQQRNPRTKVFDETQKKQDNTHQHHHHLQQRRSRAPKAVDEDLYKIPPEFLYQKPKRRVVMCDFWRRCLGLNCIP